MIKVDFIIPQSLEPYVNCIMVDESDSPDAKTRIPLFADGYPGIMFLDSENNGYFEPKHKKLSDLFLYGQTVDPAALEFEGTFRFTVFQLYPFASRYLLGVDPKVLNDDCFDLMPFKKSDGSVRNNKSLKHKMPYFQRTEIYSLILVPVKISIVSQCSDRNFFNGQVKQILFGP